MKTTVTKYDFERAFMSIRPDNFSRAGLDAMFDYFEEYEDSTDEEMELDVIAICCDWTEYENFAEFTDAYSDDYGLTWNEVQDQTTVIPVGDTGAIVGNF